MLVGVYNFILTTIRGYLNLLAQEMETQKRTLLVATKTWPAAFLVSPDESPLFPTRESL